MGKFSAHKKNIPLSQNRFSAAMSGKSDAELTAIVGNVTNFQEGAILAAALELKRRGAVSSDVEELISKLTPKLQKEREIKEFQAKLISKRIIYAGGFFVMPLIIGPFMAFNIWELGDRKAIWTVLGLSMLYLPVVIIILLVLPEGWNWLITLAHLAYVIAFVEWLWKKYLPTFEEYKNGEHKTSQ